MNMTEAQKFTQISDCVYIIEGKVIEFQPGPYDMSDPKNADSIKELAKKLYDMEQGDLPRMYGNQTITTILHEINGEPGIALGQSHISSLSDDIQKKVKAVMEWD